MIDSTNLMLVAIPTSGCCEHQTEKNNTTKRIIGPNESFAPVSKQVIITESGYIVKIPHMIGSSTTVKKLGGGYYLVSSKPTVYGAKPTTRIMTEEELVEKFKGVRLPKIGKDEGKAEKTAEEKMRDLLISLINTDPKIYYNA